MRRPTQDEEAVSMGLKAETPFHKHLNVECLHLCRIEVQYRNGLHCESHERIHSPPEGKTLIEGSVFNVSALLTGTNK